MRHSWGGVQGGGVVPLLGATIGTTKKIEGKWALALGGLNFMGRRNNQPRVGASDGGS
jgi:hypothetical protein